MAEYETSNSSSFTRDDSFKSLILPKQASKNEWLNDLMKENELLKERLSIIPNLESKILILEQNEQNMKRQKQSLQIEISDLKIQIEKFKMEESSQDNDNNKSSNSNKDLCDNLTLEETTEMIKDLLNEVEEIKKEKNDMAEKALNIFTEKELANMELREQLEELKNNQYVEIENLAKEMFCKEEESDTKYSIKKNDNYFSVHSGNSQCELFQNIKNNYQSKKNSGSFLQINYSSTTNNGNYIGKKININNNNNFNNITTFNFDQNQSQSKNFTEKIDSGLFDKDQLIKIFEEEKENMINTINNLEESLQRLSLELKDQDIDRVNEEKTLSQDEINKDEIYREIDMLNNTIRRLEEKSIKTDIQTRETICKLKEENYEFVKNNQFLKNTNENLSNEKAMIKSEFQIETKKLIETYKSDFSNKEKEIKILQSKIEEINKEKSILLYDYDNFRRSNEINKESYQKLQVSLKNITLNHDMEKKNYESKLKSYELRQETEKSILIEQISVLQAKVCKVMTSKISTLSVSSECLQNKIKEEKEKEKFCFKKSNTDRGSYALNKNLNCSNNSNTTYLTLSELEDINFENSPKTLIHHLESRIEVYETQINEFNLKINQLVKKEKENEFLKIENSNLKNNVNMIRIMYEDQLTELQKKNLLMNAEIVGLNKQLYKISPVKEKLFTTVDSNKINDNLIMCNNLTLALENCKLILAKEREIHQNEIAKSESNISGIKVQLAELTFEKESFEVKLKNENKKLKLMMNKLKIHI